MSSLEHGEDRHIGILQASQKPLKSRFHADSVKEAFGFPGRFVCRVAEPTSQSLANWLGFPLVRTKFLPGVFGSTVNKMVEMETKQTYFKSGAKGTNSQRTGQALRWFVAHGQKRGLMKTMNMGCPKIQGVSLATSYTEKKRKPIVGSLLGVAGCKEIRMTSSNIAAG